MQHCIESTQVFCHTKICNFFHNTISLTEVGTENILQIVTSDDLRISLSLFQLFHFHLQVTSRTLFVTGVYLLKVNNENTKNV